MIRIDYPDIPLKWKDVNGMRMVFDPLRKKWLLLTPEEWVRQHFLNYLIHTAGYPPSLIALEKTMKLGELSKRFDILVYDRDHQPWLMVECKAMDIPLNESTLNQLLRYNIAIPVEYLIITNGVHCFGFHRSNGRLEAIFSIPGI